MDTSPPKSANSPPSTNRTALQDSNGWDGKLRVDRRAVITNPDALSDPENSDEDTPSVEQIVADEDLLEDYEPDSDEIDLVHCRISSLPALHLERFNNVEKLCLRQNQISHIDLPPSLGPTLHDLDLYNNLISHIKDLGSLVHLISLDLSFNKIKHIKNIDHLKELRDIYFI